MDGDIEFGGDKKYFVTWGKSKITMFKQEISH